MWRFHLEQAIITYIVLNLNINFDKKILSGNVNLTVQKLQDSVDEVVSNMLIKEITQSFKTRSLDLGHIEIEHFIDFRR